MVRIPVLVCYTVREGRGGKDDKKEKLQGKLELNPPGTKWGMKAEVVLAKEAGALIGKEVWWDGKQYEAELWKNV